MLHLLALAGKLIVETLNAKWAYLVLRARLFPPNTAGYISCSRDTAELTR